MSTRPFLLAAAITIVCAHPAGAALTVEPHTTITGVGGTPTSSGAAAAVVGDVNGDGREDLATWTRCGANDLTIVFGAAAGGEVAAPAPGTRGFRVLNGNGCTSVERLGDVNGDGRGDVGIVTDRRFTVLYGRTATSTVDLAALGAGGLTITDGSPEQGIDLIALSEVGDVNGDGRADIGLSGLYITDRRIGVSGVLFGRSGGGTISVEDPAAGGLLIGNPVLTTGSTEASAIGDLNGDGRRDLLVGDSVGGPLRIIAGRAPSGFIDPSAPGAALQSIARPSPDISARPVGDLNGDGLAEITGSFNPGNAAAFTLRLSARTGTAYDFTSPARALEIGASLGRAGLPSGRAGDLTGDGRDDIIAKAIYPMADVRWLGGDMAADLTYIVRGTGAGGRIDLRMLGAWGARLDALPDFEEPVGGARFTGAGRQLVTTASTTSLTGRCAPTPVRRSSAAASRSRPPCSTPTARSRAGSRPPPGSHTRSTSAPTSRWRSSAARPSSPGRREPSRRVSAGSPSAPSRPDGHDHAGLVAAATGRAAAG